MTQTPVTCPVCGSVRVVVGVHDATGKPEGYCTVCGRISLLEYTK